MFPAVGDILKVEGEGLDTERFSKQTLEFHTFLCLGSALIAKSGSAARKSRQSDRNPLPLGITANGGKGRGSLLYQGHVL